MPLFRKHARVSVWVFQRTYSYSILVRQSAMSEAREKAKEEVDTYRAQMEAQFQEKEKNVDCVEGERDGIGCWRWICKGSGGAD